MVFSDPKATKTLSYRVCVTSLRHHSLPWGNGPLPPCWQQRNTSPLADWKNRRPAERDGEEHDQIPCIHTGDILNSCRVSGISLSPTVHARPFNDCFSLCFCGLVGPSPLYSRPRRITIRKVKLIRQRVWKP